MILRVAYAFNMARQSSLDVFLPKAKRRAEESISLSVSKLVANMQVSLYIWRALHRMNISNSTFLSMLTNISFAAMLKMIILMMKMMSTVIVVMQDVVKIH